MKSATYHVTKMDCPTEEQIIRKVLEPMPGVSALRFNLVGCKRPDFIELSRATVANGLRLLRSGPGGAGREGGAW